MKTLNANVSTMVSGAFVPIVISLIPSGLMAYGYAIWFDIDRGDWGHFMADLIFPPLGIIHGLVLLFADWVF